MLQKQRNDAKVVRKDAMHKKVLTLKKDICANLRSVFSRLRCAYLYTRDERPYPPQLLVKLNFRRAKFSKNNCVRNCTLYTDACTYAYTIYPIISLQRRHESVSIIQYPLSITNLKLKQSCSYLVVYCENFFYILDDNKSSK